MKFFVTGVGGQLGFDVVNEIISRKYAVVGSDITDGCSANCAYVKLDITDKNAVFSAIEKIAPDVVIHCAAWTAVDAAEGVENLEKVWNINVNGTRNIAEICKIIGCKMIYISTDYVFNGQGSEPWQADCKDFAPLNVYGQSKLDGELAVANLLDKYFIVRIAWVFGKNGNNFIKTMLKLSEKYPEIRVVNDQIGTPTYTYDLAHLLVDMAETEKYGFYHATNIWLKDKVEKSLKKMKEYEKKEMKPYLLHTDLRVVDQNLKTLGNSFFSYRALDYTVKDHLGKKYFIK